MDKLKHIQSKYLKKKEVKEIIHQAEPDDDVYVDSTQVTFPDSQTIIDYVLVYTRDHNKLTQFDLTANKIRKKFVNYLVQNHHIQVKEKIVRSDEREIGFILLHVPQNVLIKESNKIKLKLEQTAEKVHDSLSARLYRRFHHEMPDTHKNKLTEFHSKHRHLIMKEILDSVVYKTDTSSTISHLWSTLTHLYNRNEQVRLIRLLKEGIITSCYPLHDGTILHEPKLVVKQTNQECGPEKCRSERQLLFDHWASWKCLFRFQPINQIEHYFGPKVAFFFAWLGFYTTWLFPLALLGLVFFFFGRADPSYDEAKEFVCRKEADSILMCPLCEECTPWHLNDICFASKLNRMFDNFFTFLFAIVTTFWGIFFVEFWKRQTKKLGHAWGVLDYERDEEKPSSHYVYHATGQKKDSVSQKLVAYFPYYSRVLRRLVGFAILIGFILLSLSLHTIVIFLRFTIHHFMFMVEGLRPFATLVSNITTGILNVVFIVAIDLLYGKIAKKVTKWEMHKTETDYEESLAMKLFIFLSFNYFSHAFYIAFFKERIKFSINGKIYSETCSHTGCHIEVASYLLLTFAVKQMIKSVFDLAYPRFTSMIKSGLPYVINQWESDYQLQELEDLIDCYIYLVIQFGFVTLFVAAFPLGPLFAFLFNLLSIRINARKLLVESRRMVMKRVNGIGIWDRILSTITNLSIFSNALLIAFSSDVLEKILYMIENRTIDGFTEANLLYSSQNDNNVTCRYFETKYHGGLKTESYHYYKLIVLKLVFVITYQNIAMWIQKYIELSMHDIPRTLRIELKKEKQNSIELHHLV